MSEITMFFLTGHAKSGSSLLQNLLSEIQGVTCLGEGNFFSATQKTIPSLYDCISQGVAPWNEYIAKRKRNWLGLDEEIKTIERENYLSEEVLSNNLDTISQKMLQLFLQDLFQQKAIENNSGWIGDKSLIFRKGDLQRIPALFPKAKIIFSIRNVKDFLVSYILHYWRVNRDKRIGRDLVFVNTSDLLRADSFIKQGKQGDFVSSETALRFVSFWQELREEARKLTANSSNFYTCSYETLMTDTKQEFCRILDFLGVSYSDENVTDALSANSITELKAAGGFFADHIQNATPGKWQEYLSPEISSLIDKQLER
ncbi:MAG: sulfotransferase domain-containing protein [Spirochaetota bacterium]